MIIAYNDKSEVAGRKVSHNKQEDTGALATQNKNYVFRKEGDFYEIVFAGKPIPHKNLNGLSYIHILMQAHLEENSASDEIYALDLRKKSGSIPDDNMGRRFEEGIEDMKPIQEPILDQPGYVDVIKEMRGLKEEYRKYKENRDYERANLIQHEIGELEKWALKEYGPLYSLPSKRRKSTKDSEYADQREKARNSVSSAIKRAIEWMKNYNEDMAEHFEKSIIKGYYLSYRPEERFDWILH